MARKKKSFIDKKNSSTYHLVHRSQRDVGDVNNVNDDGKNEALSQFVLMPAAGNKSHAMEPIEIDALDDDDDNATNHEKEIFSNNNKSDNNNNNDSEDSAMMHVLSSKLSEVGLTASDYDYNRHLKPITGSGRFLSNDKQAVADPTRDARSLRVPLVDEFFTGGSGVEVERHLDSIALSPACMDEDVALALFGDDDADDFAFEEILDDFVATASSAVPLAGCEEDDDDDDRQPPAFDYDAHIRHLMERAQAQSRHDSVLPSDLKGSSHEWADKAEKFFQGATPLGRDREDMLEEQDEDEDGFFDAPPGVVPVLTPDEERALCDKFERTLLEYDSDNVGDLDHECEDIAGDRPLEGDALVEAAFDQYLEQKRDGVFMEGTNRHTKLEHRRTGGSGYSALVGKTLVHASVLGEDDDDGHIIDLADEQKEAERILANPEMEPPEEDVLIDGKSYFSVSVRNPWDCESILSTYSNLDNNPVTIGKSSRSRRSQKRQQKNQRRPQSWPEDDEEVRRITLSNKTGLPMGVLPVTDKQGDDDDDDSDDHRRHVAAPRRRGETAEEKRERKQQVKEERMIARMQKKMVKEAFKDEFGKRSMNVGVDDVGGKTVFRYS